MGDAEQPAPELLVVAQTADVPHGVDERLLDDVEAGLFVVHQFENIRIQRQLVAFEEDVPRFGVPGPGLRHGQLFAFSHYQHSTQWNAESEKRFNPQPRISCKGCMSLLGRCADRA